jgi:hypothetical protein
VRTNLRELPGVREAGFGTASPGPGMTKMQEGYDRGQAASAASRVPRALPRCRCTLLRSTGRSAHARPFLRCA